MGSAGFQPAAKGVSPLEFLALGNRGTCYSYSFRFMSTCWAAALSKNTLYVGHRENVCGRDRYWLEKVEW